VLGVAPVSLLDRYWADEDYQRMMSPVGLYSYEYVARGLPGSVRREIEESMDCLGDGVHAWDVDGPTDRPVETYPLRECKRCGIVRSNPAYVQPARGVKPPVPEPVAAPQDDGAFCECRACLY
jgi:hypothetical protein